MKESHFRSLIKAISWRLFGTFATMVIAYLFIHQLTVTLYIGLFEFVSKIGLFYLHERIWGMIPFGRMSLRSARFGVLPSSKFKITTTVD